MSIQALTSVDLRGTPSLPLTPAWSSTRVGAILATATLIVIDHGNGWQSAYAHLSGVGVSCGMSVFQGGAIGAVGTTGNSSGPHLHFELVYNGAKLNPMDYLH